MLPARSLCRCYRSFGLLAFVLVGFGTLLIPFGALHGQAQMMGGVQTPRTQSGSMPSASTSASSTASVPSTVAGQVINAKTGSPIPRALVRMNGRAMLTDHDGKFRFEQNTDANVNFIVTKPGYSASLEFQEPGNVFVQGDQLGSPIELRLYPEALLTGTLIGPDGTPLPNIAVSALASYFDESGHRWLHVGQAATNSHGDFRIPVQPGEYRLETRYQPLDRTIGEAVLPVTVPNETSSNTVRNIRIRSGEEQHFELRPVVSPTHAVTIVSQASGGRDFMRITARSGNGSTLQVNPQMDGAGETKIQLPSGTYALKATRNNQESAQVAEAMVTVTDHDVSGVVMQFSPVPSIPVEVIVDSSSTSDNSQPPNLPQLGLSLQGEQSDPERGDSAVRPTMRRDQTYVFSAEPGTYRLQGRNTGTWYIKSAVYGASDLLLQNLVVVPGAAGTPIRVTVSNQMASLQGTVDLNGNPAACWIYLIASGPNAQSVITLRSGNSGSYTVAHLPPGSYQAIAFERRHSANYRDPESLAAFSTFVHSVTIQAGDKPTLNLEAVPVAEVAP
ncbi:MAG TPA: carboxypeptidase-like regulatory domain-containing protein [Edaphobacter sp.]|nr:carboxypeptidase-like regulatory domain-containing protein [Edaphobacter sp.]